MDLFDTEQDKRLNLKPVRDFADLLKTAFANGACTCVRCVAEGGPKPTQPQHTFDLDGVTVSRRFAITSFSDVRGALVKAWEAYYKTALPDRGPADLEAISVLVGEDALCRLRHLLYASGVLKDTEEGPGFAVED